MDSPLLKFYVIGEAVSINQRILRRDPPLCPKCPLTIHVKGGKQRKHPQTICLILHFYRPDLFFSFHRNKYLNTDGKAQTGTAHQAIAQPVFAFKRVKTAF